jgi:hypothetical protein
MLTALRRFFFGPTEDEPVQQKFKWLKKGQRFHKDGKPAVKNGAHSYYYEDDPDRDHFISAWMLVELTREDGCCELGGTDAVHRM